MHSPLAIANEFIRRALQQAHPISHMQIQKLVYLAHGWCLAVTGNPLIEEGFEAWDYGPVNRQIWRVLRMYGAESVTRPIRWGDDYEQMVESDFRYRPLEEVNEVLTDVERDLIDRVWSIYGKYEAFQLSALTHEKGTPWTSTYEPEHSKRIDNTDIRDYFVRLAEAS